jgi:DNA-directed RNA polymerase subunit D
MEKITKTDEKVAFISNMNLTLANAIRRSANEIPILAIDEVDIYKNDSALYDEVLAHRIGLVPLKNQKLKEGDSVDFKLVAKANDKMNEVLSGEMGDGIVIDSIPLTILEKDQELEFVARAKQGKGIEHAKYSPGLVYYRILNKVEIGKDGEKRSELAEIFPQAFTFDGKLKVKNEWAFDLDIEDLAEFDGIKITPTDKIVFSIESWGQIDAGEIFMDAVKVLNKNLDEVAKELK